MRSRKWFFIRPDDARDRGARECLTLSHLHTVSWKGSFEGRLGFVESVVLVLVRRSLFKRRDLDYNQTKAAKQETRRETRIEEDEIGTFGRRVRVKKKFYPYNQRGVQQSCPL